MVSLADERRTWYHMDKESIIWTPKTEAEELNSGRGLGPPADARECVGIWAIPSLGWPYARFPQVGPIFLEDPREN